MKTSNKIIILFVTIMIGGMFTLVTDAKLHEKSSKRALEKAVFDLPNFSVVVAEKGADINIQQADSNKITIEFKNNKTTKVNTVYQIIKDTLFVTKGCKLFIQSKDIKSIVSKEALSVRIQVNNIDSLAIESYGGNVDVKNSQIDFLKINIKKTNMTLRKVDVNKIQINAHDKSVINILDIGSYGEISYTIDEKSTLLILKQD